jgi:uncharacterized SAM-binding protein YcdF (DUF218 family)
MKSKDLNTPQVEETTACPAGMAGSTTAPRGLFGLLNRRERWGLSGRGWLAAIASAALLFVFLPSHVYPFLAVTDRQPPSEYLIVEGWSPVDVLKGAYAEFNAGGYRKILVSGCIVYDQWTDNPGVTYAEWGASKLRRLGVPNNLIQPVPCSVQRKDRTYSSALAVKQWLDDHGVRPRQINVFTEGTHARRSRLLFQKAFGPEVKVGIIAAADPQFDPDHWWRSSEGVRDVIGESIAYIYARFLFYPTDPDQAGSVQLNQTNNGNPTPVEPSAKGH